MNGHDQMDQTQTHIVSIGVDLVDISMIHQMLARRGETLYRKVLTPAEIERLRDVHPNPATAFALCWATKEAASKALGAGLLRGFSWQDIELTPTPDRQWAAALHSGAARLAVDLGIKQVAVALAATREHAIAVVVVYHLSPLIELPVK